MGKIQNDLDRMGIHAGWSIIFGLVAFAGCVYLALTAITFWALFALVATGIVGFLIGKNVATYGVLFLLVNKLKEKRFLNADD